MWMSRDEHDSRFVYFWDQKPSTSKGGDWFSVLTEHRGYVPVEFVPNAPRRGQCVEIDGPPRVEVTVKRKAKKGAKAK